MYSCSAAWAYSITACLGSAGMPMPASRHQPRFVRPRGSFSAAAR